jgi:hypothetical protein
MVIDDPAQEHSDGDPDSWNRKGDQACAVEDARQQHAEDCKTGDPDYGGDQPQQDR